MIMPSSRIEINISKWFRNSSCGILRILKEAIEVLYSRGLIKKLFAIASFNIWLNMSTRTDDFTDIYINLMMLVKRF